MAEAAGVTAGSGARASRPRAGRKPAVQVKVFPRLPEPLPLVRFSAAEDLRAAIGLWMAWLGEAHLLAGRPAEAQDVATRALEVAREQHARGAEAVVRHLLGEIASSAGPPDGAGASAHYGSALTLAEEIGMQPLVAHCHAGLARLCHKTGDPSAAEAHLAMAAALYRGMGMAYWLEQASPSAATRGSL